MFQGEKNLENFKSRNAKCKNDNQWRWRSKVCNLRNVIILNANSDSVLHSFYLYFSFFLGGIGTIILLRFLYESPKNRRHLSPTHTNVVYEFPSLQQITPSRNSVSL